MTQIQNPHSNGHPIILSTLDIFTTLIEWANSNFQPQLSLRPLSQFAFAKFINGFEMKQELCY